MQRFEYKGQTLEFHGPTLDGVVNALRAIREDMAGEKDAAAVAEAIAIVACGPLNGYVADGLAAVRLCHVDQ